MKTTRTLNAGTTAALRQLDPAGRDRGGAPLPLTPGERDPADAVREFAADLATITVEDMRRGEHLHLPFGEGDMDVAAVLGAIEDIGWTGLVCVELSRDSHRAHEMVPAALAALR